MDNVQYTWTDISKLSDECLFNKMIYQMFLKKNTKPKVRLYRISNKNPFTSFTSEKVGCRRITTFNTNVLDVLEQSYRVLEKNLSSLILKELSEQFRLESSKRI